MHVYFTDYFRDIQYGGNVYRSGVVKRVGEVKQTKELSNYRVPVQVSGVIEDEVNRVLSSKSFLNRKLKILRVFLDNSGDIIPLYSDGSTLSYFEGVIVSSQLDESNSSKRASSTITWSCASRNYALDNVNGRLTDDESHRGLVNINGNLQPSAAAKKPEYQLDRGFTHAGNSVKLLAQYQTKEKQYRIKKRRAGGLRGLLGVKNYDLEEYWANVVREVDMNINLTAKYLPVIYGVQKTDGIPIFVDTESADPDEVWAVYAFCEGEIDGFLDIYFDDSPIICVSDTDKSKRACIGMKRFNGDTLGTLGTGKRTAASVHGEHYTYNDGNGPIEFWTYHGKSDQTAAQVLVQKAKAGEFKLQNDFNHGPEYWDDTYTLVDTAYLVVKYTLNSERTNLPQISAEIQGRKINVYNNDGIVSGDKTSLNFAWQTLDYLRSTIFGAGIPLSDIDLVSFIKCAELMDTTDTSYDKGWVPYWRYLGWTDYAAENRQIIQGSAIISTSDTVFKNIQSLIAQFDASLNIVNGKYTLTMEAEAPSVADIDEGEIIDGSIKISDRSMEDKFNSVQASIIDPAKGWGTNTITFYNKDYKREDGNKDRKANISFPYITNYYTARTRAEYYLRKSRYNRVVTFMLPFNYVWLYPNAPITISKKRYGWDKKQFLIQDLTWSSDGKIRVTAREYADSVFINSPKTDDSSSQIPDIIVGILPPRDLRYEPNIGESKVGLNGSLVWAPSVTKRVAYYTVKYTGLADVITVPVVSGAAATTFIRVPLYNLDPGEYTFEVRAIGPDGDSSMPAKLTTTINPSAVLSKVTGFHIVNAAFNQPKVFIGKDLTLGWDPIVETGEVPGLRYQLNFYNMNTDIPMRTVTTTGTEYTYTLAMNKEDYKSLNGTLGVFRDLRVTISAIGDNNVASLEETVL